MTDGISLRWNETEMKARLQHLRSFALGRRILGIGLHRIGLRARVIHVQNFRASGTRFGAGRWKPISWMTALLRKGGVFNDWDDIHDRAAKSRPLADTGELERSVLGSGKGAVLKVDGLRLQVGSNLAYADLHQEGGKKRFDLTPDVMRRLRRAIKDTLGPGRPTETAAGNDSYAQKRWNPFFFSVLGALKKREGKMLEIPRRQFILKDTDITAQEKKDFERILTETLNETDVKI